MNFLIKRYSTLPDDALSLRITVFVREQGFCDAPDDIDKTATHLVLYHRDGTPLATCRVYRQAQTGHFVLGRFCVLKEYRGQGLGKALLVSAEAVTRELGGNTLWLHAQYRARGFYESLGYTQHGELEYEQNSPHIWLKKDLN